MSVVSGLFVPVVVGCVLVGSRVVFVNQMPVFVVVVGFAVVVVVTSVDIVLDNAFVVQLVVYMVVKLFVVIFVGSVFVDPAGNIMFVIHAVSCVELPTVYQLFMVGSIETVVSEFVVVVVGSVFVVRSVAVIFVDIVSVAAAEVIMVAFSIIDSTWGEVNSLFVVVVAVWLVLNPFGEVSTAVVMLVITLVD